MGMMGSERHRLVTPLYCNIYSTCVLVWKKTNIYLVDLWIAFADKLVNRSHFVKWDSSFGPPPKLAFDCFLCNLLYTELSYTYCREKTEKEREKVKKDSEARQRDNIKLSHSQFGSKFVMSGVHCQSQYIAEEFVHLVKSDCEGNVFRCPTLSSGHLCYCLCYPAAYVYIILVWFLPITWKNNTRTPLPYVIGHNKVLSLLLLSFNIVYMFDMVESTETYCIYCIHIIVVSTVPRKGLASIGSRVQVTPLGFCLLLQFRPKVWISGLS